MFCEHCGNQVEGEVQFCARCGNSLVFTSLPKNKKEEGSTKKYFLFVLIGFIVFVLVGLAIFAFQSSPKDSNFNDQSVASTVVNIYCEDASGDEENLSGGSGTIITTEGLVLTNAHIIPQGEDASSNEKSCLVVLPDPETGSPKEIYYAKPLVIPDISEKYDLAFVQIDDVFYDEEAKVARGEYPKKFPAYDSERYCNNEDVKLGEPVRIYGYPAISGGYALTVTDGIVSSLLPNENLIITSAKISHGNSGGLAVDQHGCRIGIPSMVSSDENESLGVIISNNLIFNFIDEIKKSN